MPDENQRQPNQPPPQPNPERKTLDDRAQMTELERLRHSCAHVMATAILRLWPDAQFAAGPPVEQGFYYDVDLQHRITPEDFPAIEAEMKKEIKANHVFEKKVVTREQAIADAQSGRATRASSSSTCSTRLPKASRLRVSGKVTGISPPRLRCGVLVR